MIPALRPKLRGFETETGRRLMLNAPKLSTEHLDSFKRDGFVVLRGGFSAAEVAEIEAATSEIVARPEQSGKHWVYHETSLKNGADDLVCRIENLSPFHPGFAELSAALKPSAGQLLGEDSVLFKEKINFKMPGGDGFTPHQDSQAGWDAYAPMFVSVLVSIDAATIENGCLEMVAGFHQKGIYRPWEPLTDDDMAEMEFVAYPTEPGDIVYFDCYAPHKSAPNMSDKIRRIYFATYNRLSDGEHMAEYYADKHTTYPPDIDRDPDKEYRFRV